MQEFLQLLLSYSWGAFRFTYDLLGIYILVLLLTGNFSERVVRQYAIGLFTSICLMMLFPRVGGDFILGLEGIGPIAVLLIIVVYSMVNNVSQKMHPKQFRRILVGTGFIFLVVGILLAILAFSVGFIVGIGDKFISVIIPTGRISLPLIDSVAEHQPLTWGSLYSNMNVMAFLIPFGLFEAFRRPTEKKLLIITFGLTTIYFSGSLIRLILLLSPAAVILSALAIESLLTPYALISHKRVKIKKTRISKNKIGNMELALPYLLAFGLMLSVTFSGIYLTQRQYTAPDITISTTGDPKDANYDWFQAFDWMKKYTSYNAWEANGGIENGPPPVILSWWDYGYYISIKGETASLVDNATINSTQIGTVGTMLMWNASESIKLMYKYNVKYVLVNSQAGQLGLGSDIGKSIWMMKISEQYTPQYGIVEEDFYSSAEGGYHGRYLDSVLFRLMAYRAPDMTASASPFSGSGNWENTIAQNLVSVQVTSLQYFTEVFRSNGFANEGLTGDGSYPLVRIYEVNYPENIDLLVSEFNEVYN